MTRLFEVFLLLFVAFSPQFITGNMQPFCYSRSNKYYEPKLPSFPDAFEATVEVNIVDRNYTNIFTEYYDKNANKGALRATGNGTTIYMIYNYNENEMMVIDEGNRKCSLQEITTMHGFPFFGRNGSRIQGMADLFRFGASFNETFIGNETVRGIPCFHWQACINHHNYSYLVDYYFSTSDWSMAYGSGKMQVVRAAINGTTTHRYRSNGSLPGNSTRSFYHVYDFFSFKEGPPEQSAFQVPRGVFCAGMKDRKPLPEMKSVLSLELEWLNLLNKTVFNMKEYYDIDRNLAMSKYYDYRHRSYGETRIIHDFTHGIVYNISGTVCCNVTLLSLNNTWDAKETADHHIRMKTFSEALYSENRSSLIYRGSTTVRGIDADVWIMKREWGRRHKREVTAEYYYSKKSWNMRAGSLHNQSQVLLRMDIYDPIRHRNARMNVINYDAEPVPLSVFNIHHCFLNNLAIISIKLKGDGDWIKETFKYKIQFNAGVRNSVARVANVSNLRIDNIWSGKSSEYIQIWFTLLGKPPVTSPDVKIVEKNLTEAIEALKKTVQQGKLEIMWHSPEQGKMTKKAEKFFYNSRSVNTTSSPVSPTDDHHGKTKAEKGGVPGGAVAGIAFLMIAIGICIGLGIAHVIMRRRGTSLFQYQRQE